MKRERSKITMKTWKYEKVKSYFGASKKKETRKTLNLIRNSNCTFQSNPNPNSNQTVTMKWRKNFSNWKLHTYLNIYNISIHPAITIAMAMAMAIATALPFHSVKAQEEKDENKGKETFTFCGQINLWILCALCMVNVTWKTLCLNLFDISIFMWWSMKMSIAHNIKCVWKWAYTFSSFVDSNVNFVTFK